LCECVEFLDLLPLLLQDAIDAIQFGDDTLLLGERGDRDRERK
jgi:hypothetical protein